MDKSYFLIIAYTVAWLGVAFFVFSSSKKQNSIEQKLNALEDKLKR